MEGGEVGSGKCVWGRIIGGRGRRVARVRVGRGGVGLR